MYAPITGVGSGIAPVVNLTFDYVDEASVKAAVDGVEVTFTWTGASQITFDDVVAADADWMVYRETSISLPMVDFMDSSVLTEADLDTAHAQLRHHQEEIDFVYGTSAVAAESASNAEASATAAASSAALADASADAAEAAAAIAASAAEVPNASANASSRAALSILSSAVPAILAEGGREGVFVFDSSDLSAEVTADPLGGIYVAPVSDVTGASGAWVRKFTGPVNVKWFGATGDGVTDDSAAFLAALALLKATAVNQVVTWYEGSTRLFIPAGHYYLGTTTLDLTHTLIIEGDGGGQPGGVVTKLRWADATTGIRVQKHNTEGATGTTSDPFKGADGTTIRNLMLVGGYTGAAEGEFHGIHLRARAVVEDCVITDFPGDGIHGAGASGGSPEGNLNNTSLTRISSYRNRRGVYFDSADANACLITMLDASANRTWGVEDSSFLGNTYVGCHVSANGWDGAASSIPTACTYAGNRYAVKTGMAAAASTNAPSGTTEDNAWWLYVSAGGIYNGVVPWVSGTTFREGGAYKTDDNSAANVLIGCYSEGDQGPSQIVNPTLVVGGLHGTNVKGTGAWLAADGTSNAVRVVGGTGGGVVVRETVGGSDYFKARSDGLDWNSHYQLKFFDPDFAWTVLESAVPSNWAFRINGDATAHPVGMRRLVFDNGFGLGEKKVLTGTAAPASGAYNQGDMMFNSAPVAGGPMGWVCVTGGSPGTWKAMANLAA